MVCGTQLVYASDAIEQTCNYCDEVYQSPIYCPDGHFVCDSCHSSDALAFLGRLAENSKIVEPQEVVELAYQHHSVHFHGPEHHALVPAALLIAMKNRGIKRPDGVDITAETVLEGIRRGAKIPGGFCGYAGTCGACVGAGVTVALYLGSTPRRAREREMAHRATAEAIEMVRDGLVRCCKRSTFYGLTAAMNLLRQTSNIDLGTVPQPKSCQHSERNRDCEKEKCRYYPGN